MYPPLGTVQALAPTGVSGAWAVRLADEPVGFSSSSLNSGPAGTAIAGRRSPPRANRCGWAGRPPPTLVHARRWNGSNSVCASGPATMYRGSTRHGSRPLASCLICAAERATDQTNGHRMRPAMSCATVVRCSAPTVVTSRPAGARLVVSADPGTPSA